MNKTITLDNIAELAAVMNNYPYDDFDPRITEDTWQVFDSDETIKHNEVTLGNAAIGRFVFSRINDDSKKFKLTSSSQINDHIQFTWGCIVDFVNRVIENPELLKDYQL